MTFVDEQPKRQSAPQHQNSQQQQQQQQRGSITSKTAPTVTANRNSGYIQPPPPGQRVTSYVGEGGAQDQYQNDSGSISSSTRRLLSSSDSSPRSDHGHDVDPFQSTGPGATGGGDRKGSDGEVVLNMGTMSQPPPGYRASMLSTGPIIIDNNNNNNNTSSSILNNTHNYDIDERRCRICLEGEDDDSTRSTNQDRSRGNHRHNHSDEEDEESEKNRLISPCLCKGSTRYIHLGCLEQWRTTSSHRENFYRCEICHYKYSFRRPWAASILGSKWFLRVTTVLIVILLAYAFAWIGRAIDSKSAWHWKRQFNPDGDFPLNTVMGLDWMDVIWGVLFTTGAGFMIVIIGLLVGMAMSLSCCCSDNENEDGEENTGGCFDRSCGWGYCGCYCGDCGGGGGGEFVIIMILVGIVLVG
ncbi:hypothetical protein BGX30_005355, partial [Mortierella sp. GBA39]